MSETEIFDPGEFALVLSVGGSPAPLIKSIEHYKPESVIFVASKDSNEKIKEILSHEKSGSIKRFATIILSNHEDLVECVREIREAIPAKLENLKLPADKLLIADITGGSKCMSSALTLAMMDFRCKFNYVGGKRRDKDGLGAVVDGEEKNAHTLNPWDAMGLTEARPLVSYFNSGQFAAAREKALFLKSRLPDYSPFYDGLALIIEGFESWDVFDLRRAKNLFEQGMGKMRAYDNKAHKNFKPLYERLRKAQSILNEVAEDAAILTDKKKQRASIKGDAYLRDLIANARRRAERGRFDDAAARLYSAVEKTAKIALAKKGINNSDVTREQLDAMGPDLIAKYSGVFAADAPLAYDGKPKKVQLPLTDSYLALLAIEPEAPLSVAYREHAEELQNVLSLRNQSLLAHGYDPVTEEHYKKFEKIAMDFLGVNEDELSAFPEIKLSEILF